MYMFTLKPLLMKNLILIISTCIVLSASAQTTYHARFLLNGVQKSEKKFKLNGWVIAPDMISDPTNYIGLIGTSINISEKTTLELLLGGVISSKTGYPMFDVRFAYNPTEKWKTYTIGEIWYSENAVGLYGYAHLERQLFKDAFIGIETEDVINKFYSVGGHLHFIVGKLHLIPAYQRRWPAHENQIWLRTLVVF